MKTKNLRWAAVLVIANLFLLSLINAQTPQRMSYQAVVRGANNEFVANGVVGIQVSILFGSVNGAAIYTERHTPSTNGQGLISLEIGGGNIVSGSFEAIDWANGPYFIKTETDPTGGTSYTLSGTSQLLSVPYALHAMTVENDAVDDADSDPNNELVTNAQLNGTSLEITDAGGTQTVDLSSLQGTGTDNQTISLSGTNLSITGGNTIDLSSLQDGTTDADADPNNELITNAQLTGTSLEITDAGGTQTVDLSSLQVSGTDNQTISLSGTDLSITGGNTIDLSSLQDGTGTDSQTIGLTGTNLSISNGNSVDLSSIQDGTGTDAQTISLSGTDLSISNGNTIDVSSLQDGTTDADADPNNELITGAQLNGTSLEVTDAGGTKTVDLSSLQDGTGTDTQTISLSGTDLTISNGNTIDVSSLQDGTTDADADPGNELITGAQLNGTSLELTDAGGTTTVDLSSLQDGTGTDSQTIGLTGTNLSISNGNTIDVSSLQDGTTDADADPNNELITNAQLNGTSLEVTDAGGTTTVDLSSLQDGTGTDAQTISLSGTDLSISNGNTIDVSSLQDGTTDADADPNNELITNAQLNGTSLEVTDAGGTTTVDLSSLQDGTGTDAQTISLSGTDLSISNGNTIDVSALQDGTTDADADPNNELITSAQLNGTSLEVTDAGGTTTVDLSSLQDGTGTDAQTISLTGTDLTITNGNTIDVSALQDGTTDADADPANEIQNITLIDDKITITNNASANELDLTPYKNNWSETGTDIHYTAGKVGIGTATPSDGSVMELNSVTGGLILPRMTTAQRDALALNAGMVIFNTDTEKFQGCLLSTVDTEDVSYENTTAIVAGEANLRTHGINLVFTAVRDGFLTQVSVLTAVNQVANVNALRVYNAHSNDPSACPSSPNLLATSDDVSMSSNTWIDFTFSSPLAVTAGTTYYFWSKNNATSLSHAIRIQVSTNSPTGQIGIYSISALCGLVQDSTPVVKYFVTEYTGANPWVDLH